MSDKRLAITIDGPYPGRSFQFPREDSDVFEVCEYRQDLGLRYAVYVLADENWALLRTKNVPFKFSHWTAWNCGPPKGPKGGDIDT